MWSIFYHLWLAQSELICNNGAKEDLCQWEFCYPNEAPSDDCDNISHVGMLISNEDTRAGLCLPARWWVQNNNIDNKYSFLSIVQMIQSSCQQYG